MHTIVRFARPLLCAVTMVQLVLTGCTQEHPKSERAPSVPSQAASSRPDQSDRDDDGCDLVRAAANPDPDTLVREYVRRDARGEFLRSTPWSDSAYECPGHLAAPDAFTVVARSSIVPLSRTDSVARYEVRSIQIGNLTQDSARSVFIPSRETKRDTFVVVHTPFGWRIREPQLPDNIGVETVLADSSLYRLKPRDRAKLRGAQGDREKAPLGTTATSGDSSSH